MSLETVEDRTDWRRTKLNHVLTIISIWKINDKIPIYKVRIPREFFVVIGNSIIPILLNTSDILKELHHFPSLSYMKNKCVWAGPIHLKFKCISGGEYFCYYQIYSKPHRNYIFSILV